MERVSIYHPRKRKRTRRQWGKKKRESHRRYLSNPAMHRLQSRKRYQQHYKRNFRFKRKRKFYQKHRSIHRRLAAEQSDPCIFFLMPMDDGDFRGGCVTGLWAGTWLVEFEYADGEQGEMGIDEFLGSAVMEDNEDVDQFFDKLTAASEKVEASEDGWDVGWTLDDERVAESASFDKPDPSRVASMHLGFNKHNPSELLSQLVAVLAKAKGDADGTGKDGLDKALTEVRGIAKTVQNAWSSRKDE